MKINLRSPKTLGTCIVVFIFVLVAIGVAHFYIFGSMREMSSDEIASLRAEAERGDYEVEGKLARLYEHGWGGVKRDYKEAYILLSMAYVQVSEPELSAAREQASEVLNHLTPQERAEADRRVLDWIKAHPSLVVRQPFAAPQ
jgi:hypothetical protein